MAGSDLVLCQSANGAYKVQPRPARPGTQNSCA
jgi:hypothetical protein